MRTTHRQRMLAVAFALLLPGCREPFELYIERAEEDEKRSCDALCYDAVTSADTQADGTSSHFTLISCEDVDDVDGREMVVCHFSVPE